MLWRDTGSVEECKKFIEYWRADAPRHGSIEPHVQVQAADGAQVVAVFPRRWTSGIGGSFAHVPGPARRVLAWMERQSRRPPSSSNPSRLGGGKAVNHQFGSYRCRKRGFPAARSVGHPQSRPPLHTGQAVRCQAAVKVLDPPCVHPGGGVRSSGVLASAPGFRAHSCSGAKNP